MKKAHRAGSSKHSARGREAVAAPACSRRRSRASTWRDRILNEFTLGAARLALAADPFPGLSTPVVAALEPADLDSLHDAQARKAPGVLGDEATKDFVLRHVFGFVPEIIAKPTDLLRVLLRRHYSAKRVPPMLDERFIQLVCQHPGFAEWPLGAIVPDRVYIDNLFAEGMLRPVSHERSGPLSQTWVSVGVRAIGPEDRAHRLNRLLEAAATAIPRDDARHGNLPSVPPVMLHHVPASARAA